MLVVIPAKARTTTATTPTPIGCKLLKINLLSTPPSQRCRFERCAFYVVHIKRQHLFSKWLRGQDLNLRPSGYEPDELPDCSTPRLSQMKPRQSRSGTIAKRVPPRQHLPHPRKTPANPKTIIPNDFNRLMRNRVLVRGGKNLPAPQDSRKPCTFIVQTVRRQTRYHSASPSIESPLCTFPIFPCRACRASNSVLACSPNCRSSPADTARTPCS